VSVAAGKASRVSSDPCGDVVAKLTNQSEGSTDILCRSMKGFIQATWRFDAWNPQIIPVCFSLMWINRYPILSNSTLLFFIVII
jgi:hypothetical protein